MWRDLPPAILPAAAALAGVALGPELGWRPAPLLLLALAALALRLGGGAGRLGAGLAVGLLAGSLTGLDTLAAIEPDRPVAAVVRVGSVRLAPRQQEWVARVEVERLRQGERVWHRPGPVFLHLPATATRPARGEEVRVRGFLRRSEGHLNAVPTAPGPYRLRVKSEYLLTREEPENLWGALQRSLDERLPAPGWGREGEALTRALVLGRPEALPERGLRAMRRAGLGHLLALSGLHVSMLAAATAFFLAWLPPLAQRLAIALAVAGYLAIAGPSPSLLRSSLMALLAVAALASRRRPLVLNALAVVAAGLALLSPRITRDLAFQLSCSATAGILLAGGVIAPRWRRAPLPLRWLALGITMSLAAQLASLPFALPAFARLGLASLPLNLVAIPWITLFLLLAFGWVAVALAAPGVAATFGPALDFVARPLAWSELLPPSRWVAFAFPASFGTSSLLACAGGAALLLPWRRARFVLLAGAGLLLQGAPSASGQPPVEVVFFDVGQGDATLLRDGRHAVLVDGGGIPGVDLGARVLAPNLAWLGLHELAALVVTHPDADHCAGLLDLARSMPVRELIVADWEGDGDGSDCLAELGSIFRGRIRRLAEGDRFEAGRWRFEVPQARLRDLARGNDRSLVLIAEAEGRRLLLAGDVERRGEERLAAPGVLGGRFDLLKVPHHGSASSSSERLLAVARPRLAVISCGARNRFGHPGTAALARLRAQGSVVWRTDRGGMVVVRWRPGGPLALWRPLPGRRAAP